MIFHCLFFHCFLTSISSILQSRLLLYQPFMLFNTPRKWSKESAKRGWKGKSINVRNFEYIFLSQILIHLRLKFNCHHYNHLSIHGIRPWINEFVPVFWADSPSLKQNHPLTINNDFLYYSNWKYFSFKPILITTTICIHIVYISGSFVVHPFAILCPSGRAQLQVRKVR